LSVVVHPADVQDRDGAFDLLRRARRLFPFVKRIFADGGYAGAKMALVVSRTGSWTLQIVKRSTATGFEVLPKRWIVTVRTMLPSWVSSGHRSSNAGAADGDRSWSRWAQNKTRVNLSQATQSQRKI
jgi:transposase